MYTRKQTCVQVRGAGLVSVPLWCHEQTAHGRRPNCSCSLEIHTSVQKLFNRVSTTVNQSRTHQFPLIVRRFAGLGRVDDDVHGGLTRHRRTELGRDRLHQHGHHVRVKVDRLAITTSITTSASNEILVCMHNHTQIAVSFISIG